MEKIKNPMEEFIKSDSIVKKHTDIMIEIIGLQVQDGLCEIKNMVKEDKVKEKIDALDRSLQKNITSVREIIEKSMYSKDIEKTSQQLIESFADFDKPDKKVDREMSLSMSEKASRLSEPYKTR